MGQFIDRQIGLHPFLRQRASNCLSVIHSIILPVILFFCQQYFFPPVGLFCQEDLFLCQFDFFATVQFFFFFFFRPVQLLFLQVILGFNTYCFTPLIFLIQVYYATSPPFCHTWNFAQTLHGHMLLEKVLPKNLP